MNNGSPYDSVKCVPILYFSVYVVFTLVGSDSHLILSFLLVHFDCAL